LGTVAQLLFGSGACRIGASNFNGEDALVVFDGWNVTVAPAKFMGASVAPNLDADPTHSPETGLPFQTEGLR